MIVPFVLAAFGMMTSTVPVVICGMPDPSNHADPPGPTMSVPVPPGAAKKLAAYWLWSGNAFLAPRGLQCQGDVGEDGSESLRVGRMEQGHLVPVLSIGTDFGCEGCKLSLAACFFPQARSAYLTADGIEPTCPAVPRERRVRAGSDVVLFEDPPGVKGSGDSSGGALRAYGALYWGGVAGIATCLLPERDRPLCTVMLNHFIRTERENAREFNQ